MPCHQQKKITLKEESIDEEMISLVIWLNKSPEIFTRWSCQGVFKDREGCPIQRAYIIFYCFTYHILERIQEAIETSHATLNFHINTDSISDAIPSGQTRYILEFPNTLSLSEFRKQIQEITNYPL